MSFYNVNGDDGLRVDSHFLVLITIEKTLRRNPTVDITIFIKKRRKVAGMKLDINKTDKNFGTLAY